jgi:hypothetical protein
MFNNDTAPVAHSIMRLLRKSSEQSLEPFQEYVLYWVAFNNIYTTVAENEESKSFIPNSDGNPKTFQLGDVTMRRVKALREKDQLEIVLNAFSDDLKYQLITHSSTKFFVYRAPKWRGKEIKFDKMGQRVNGVINVGKTISSDFPYWSPISVNLYESYIKAQQDEETREILSDQILKVLYTVRNNTFHGGKRFDDANDAEVLHKATPLLAMIVQSFLTT